MSDVFSAERVAADVLVIVHRAAQAGIRQDMQGVVSGLTAAVHLYEQCPSRVHGTLSQIDKVLDFIRHARGLYQRLGWVDSDLWELEQRAEALRKPLH